MSTRPGGSSHGLIVRKSPYDHPETVRRLTDQISRRGLHLFTQIDHAAAAARAGMSLPPTTVIVFGDPAIGTPIMQSCPDFALELPTRILVRTVPAGATWVIHYDVTRQATRYGLPSESLRPLYDLGRLVTSVLDHHPRRADSPPPHVNGGAPRRE